MKFLGKRMAIGPSSPGVHVSDVDRIMGWAQVGWDLTQPRILIHELHLPTEAGTRALLPIIDRDDRDIRAVIDPTTGESRVTVKHTTILTPDAVQRMRSELENAANAFGGTYVGWDPEIDLSGLGG